MSSAVVDESRYSIRRLLGSGGMARVYLAWDAVLKRPVALKLLSESLSADDAVRARFVREGELAARLAHPNVVRVYDAGGARSSPYIVMEYVEGTTLADKLAAGGPLPRPKWPGLPPRSAAVSTTPTPRASSTGTSSRTTCCSDGTAS